METLAQLIKEERNRTSTQLNVQDLLDHGNIADYLGNKTLKDISNDVVKSLQTLTMDKDVMIALCEKLLSYRYIDHVYQLHRGKHIRWIRLPWTISEEEEENTKSWTPRLANGGTVLETKFTENGTHLLCRTGTRFFKLNYDNYLIYQKLSTEEQMILSCNSIVDKKNIDKND